LGGVIVADDANADLERIFVIGLLRKVPGEAARSRLTAGRATDQRFRHVVGHRPVEAVNLSHTAHAMHLHGFYFNVESTVTA
jgi:hypothetical protein